jgi:membrane protease YdiL (CAAX protease family)
MSLIALVISKLSKGKDATDTHFIIANTLSALLFAAVHLPATAMSIGITPIIVFRCLLMNGAFGILFGRMYRKYGIGYAMLTHAGVHIVSKLIWILFI